MIIVKEIKNIIFDMGRVLLKFDPYVSLKTYCENKEDRELIYKELFESPEWIMGDEGKITNGQRYELVKERIPERLHRTLKLVVENWDMCMEPVEGALEFYAWAKRSGYHTFVLSNACNRFYRYFPKFYDLNSFEGVVVSSDIKMIKPNPEIYQYILKTYSLNSEECLFIDDVKANVEAAEKEGIHGFVFQNNFEKLKDMLGIRKS
ncbi:MAG: HAD family phosphatase [Lachnospiraceae bacterium]|nr:HAD family phosphatase [Lachnospiraceae bacterium]